jgi:hypothetical protein
MIEVASIMCCMDVFVLACISAWFTKEKCIYQSVRVHPKI